MKTMMIYMMTMVTVFLVGCATEPQIGMDGDDQVVADLVADAVGYRSSGLAATIQDLVAVGENGLKAEGSPDSDPIVKRSVREGYSPITLERDSLDACSQWRRTLTLHPAIDGAHSDAVVAEISGERNVYGTRMNVQGESSGRILFNRSPMQRDGLRLDGEFECVGRAVSQAADGRRYHSVSVDLTFNRLEVVAGVTPGHRGILGRCDVIVSAGSAQGVISKSGVLVFDGTDTALLTLNGRKYIIDIAQAEFIPLA